MRPRPVRRRHGRQGEAKVIDQQPGVARGLPVAKRGVRQVEDAQALCRRHGRQGKDFIDERLGVRLALVHQGEHQVDVDAKHRRDDRSGFDCVRQGARSGLVVGERWLKSVEDDVQAVR